MDMDIVFLILTYLKKKKKLCKNNAPFSSSPTWRPDCVHASSYVSFLISPSEEVQELKSSELMNDL